MRLLSVRFCGAVCQCFGGISKSQDVAGNALPGPSLLPFALDSALNWCPVGTVATLKRAGRRPQEPAVQA